MKKKRCIKCQTYFKDRQEEAEKNLVHKDLCWNCRFVWTTLGLVIKSFPAKINREIALNLDYIAIYKPTKWTEMAGKIKSGK